MVLVNSLQRELKKRGHRSDILSMPYLPSHRFEVLEEIKRWHELRLSRELSNEVNLVIATKFPTYHFSFKKKSIWLVHQHRFSEELFGTNFSTFTDSCSDTALRKTIIKLDTQSFQSSDYLSSISRTVADRAAVYNNQKFTTLYPPLNFGTSYYCEGWEPYIFYAGRICSIKRLDLIIKSLPNIDHRIKLKIAGMPEERGVDTYLKNEIKKHHLTNRVEFLGRVSDADLLTLYANCSLVYYAPYQEDYGYVTLEAMASKKPVVTCSDSGGPLEFVKDLKNGIISEPNTTELAARINEIILNVDLLKKLGEDGYMTVSNLGILDGWDQVIDGLLSPLR